MNKSLREANEMFKQKNYLETIGLCQSILTENKESKEAWKLFGRALMNLSQIEKASKCFRNVIELDKLDFESIYYLGTTYYLSGNKELAKKYYKEALDINNDYPPALTSLGNIELMLGNKEEALKLQLRTIKNDPKHSSAWSSLSNCYLQLGQLDIAEKAAKKSIELNPKLYIPYNYLALIQKARENLSQAKINIKKAIELSPKSTNNYLLYSSILKQSGEFVDAELIMRKAILLDPNLEKSYISLGSLLKEQGKLEQALIPLIKATELNHNNALNYYNIGSILLDLGRLDEAEGFTKKSMAINKNLSQAYINLISILIGRGNKEEATEKLVEAMMLDSTSIDFQVRLIQFLCTYNPIKKDLHPLIRADNEIKREIKRNIITSINSSGISKIYTIGVNALSRNSIHIDYPLSQICRSYDYDLNCSRHKTVFENFNIIPEFCFSCYKVQIDLSTVIDLIKLLFIFEGLSLKNNNIRKCMVEMRNNVPGLYKGLIYCSSLIEAKNILEVFRKNTSDYFLYKPQIKVKRGCNEYSVAYPLYKVPEELDPNVFKYKEAWKKIEVNYDKRNPTPKVMKIDKKIVGLGLNDFLVIRNWLVYAQQIGDPTVDQITHDNLEDLEIAKAIKQAIPSKLMS